jgi:hypothetical protein
LLAGPMRRAIFEVLVDEQDRHRSARADAPARATSTALSRRALPRCATISIASGRKRLAI